MDVIPFICIYIYIYSVLSGWGPQDSVQLPYKWLSYGLWYWVNYNDLTATSLEIIVKGNHPQMAARFRLVKYYNLSRYTIHIVSIFDMIINPIVIPLNQL